LDRCVATALCAGLVLLTGCQRQSDQAPRQAAASNDEQPLALGEFGRAVQAGQPATNIATFDTLDFDVFSNQKWDRLNESHTDDVIVSWPDGHETKGIGVHIEDLKKLFLHAPDTAAKIHPIRIANGDWTAVTGVMTGTFTKPMTLADGTVIQPTGKSFSVPMATFGHWKNGKMDHEWLYWDNATYMTQMGIGK
jgi:predicted ester cyclase